MTRYFANSVIALGTIMLVSLLSFFYFLTIGQLVVINPAIVISF